MNGTKTEWMLTWNGRERVDRSPCSSPVLMICRKWTEEKRSPLLRPWSVFSRRYFLPTLHHALSSSIDSMTTDRDRGDSCSSCGEDRFPEEEIRVILWLAVECRRCMASSDSTEDQGSNPPCHQDEFDWIRNESKLRAMRSVKVTSNTCFFTWNRLGLFRQCGRFAKIAQKFE